MQMLFLSHIKKCQWINLDYSVAIFVANRVEPDQAALPDQGLLHLHRSQNVKKFFYQIKSEFIYIWW